MPINASLNTKLLQSAYTDWQGIYRDKLGREVDARQDRIWKKEQDIEQKKLRDYTYGQLKADNMSKLVVSSESKHQGVQSYLQHMGNQLVNRQTELLESYENGDMDSNTFAAESAKISSQVPQIKGFVKQLDTGLGIYSAGLAEKSLSSAMSTEDDYLWKAITDGKGEFGLDDNNILVYQGKTENGDDFSFPANKLNQMPMPLLKVDSFEQNTLPIAMTLAKPVSEQLPNGEWTMRSIGLQDPRFKETIRGSFDTFLSKNGGELALKSLAADHAGYSREKITSLLNSGTFEGPDGEEYANQLEYEMEQDWLASAADQYQNYITTQFNGPMYNAQTARINALKNPRQQGMGTLAERKIGRHTDYVKKLPQPTESNIKQWLEGNPSNWQVQMDKNGDYILYQQLEKGGVNKKTARKITKDILKDSNKLAQLLAAQVWGVDPTYHKFNY